MGDLEFDLRLHVDPAQLCGTQFFELLPGPYGERVWVKGSRFIHEYAFALIEGIFEHRVPDYDHFSVVEVSRQQWKRILDDLAILRANLTSGTQPLTLPVGSLLDVRPAFNQMLAENQRGLAQLISELAAWLHETLSEHEVISILGL